MTESQHITLRELQRRVKSALEGQFALPLWVSAEISEIKVNYSGHCYLELVEKGGDNGVPTAQARAVVWRSNYPRIAGYFEAETGQRLAAGIKILAKALVTYHELYGFSLQITDIDPSYTLGDMERQRQQTIAQLQQEGVWDMNREAPMPAVVQRVAIVSSANAAGYQDFCKELARSPYRFELTLFDAFMQGEAAEESIIEALCNVAARPEKFDAVVLIRGGGSRSDLNCFNAYRLCAHVAQFPLPVVTGIGHDKDTSVADMVAHTALKTPTAVAGWLVERMAETDGWLDCAALHDEGRDARLGGASRTPLGRSAAAERRTPHAADAASGTFHRAAARRGARLPRAAGRAARQRRGTDRRTFARTHPPAGIRRPARRRPCRDLGRKRRGGRAGRNRGLRRQDRRNRKFRKNMAKKEVTYAEAMAEIEKILARLRNEEMDVDSLAAEVKRATELIASCKARLRKAEADVNKILE